MSLTLEIPEAVEQALRLPAASREQQLLCELAVSLYERGILSLGKARELAGLDRLGFSLLLGQRQVLRHYGEAELEEDLRYARSE